MRVLPSLAAALAILAGSLASPARSQTDPQPVAPPGSVEAFDQKLLDIADLSQRGKPAEAKTLLLAAVNQAADAPWILTRVGTVRDRLRVTIQGKTAVEASIEDSAANGMCALLKFPGIREFKIKGRVAPGRIACLIDEEVHQDRRDRTGSGLPLRG